MGYLLSAVFLALYIMLDRDRLRGGLFAVVPRHYHIRLSRVLISLEAIVGGYIRGQALTSGLMAVFAFILLTACGVSDALAIAVFAGLADVLPYIGVVLSVLPAAAAAATQGLVTTIVVVAAMLAYEELESRFLIPRIYGKTLRLPSSMVLLALLVGGTLMGIVGALLALPVASAIRMLVEELRVELPGEEIDDGPLRASDARAERIYAKRSEGMPAQQAAAIAVEISEERKQAPEGEPVNR
jgi:predicted PurR-regulated permease PerM